MNDTPGAIPPPTAEDLKLDALRDYGLVRMIDFGGDASTHSARVIACAWIRRAIAAETRLKESDKLLDAAMLAIKFSDGDFAQAKELLLKQQAVLDVTTAELAALRETCRDLGWPEAALVPLDPKEQPR